MDIASGKRFGDQHPYQGVSHPQEEPAYGYPIQAGYPPPQQSFQQNWPAMTPPEYNQPLYSQSKINPQDHQEAPPRPRPRRRSFLQGLLACFCCCCRPGDGCCGGCGGCCGGCGGCGGCCGGCGGNCCSRDPARFDN